MPRSGAGKARAARGAGVVARPRGVAGGHHRGILSWPAARVSSVRASANLPARRYARPSAKAAAASLERESLANRFALAVPPDAEPTGLPAP